LKAAFNNDSLNSFLTGLMAGRESLEDMKTEMEFKKVSNWDGKDAPIIEEVSLTDLSYLGTN